MTTTTPIQDEQDFDVLAFLRERAASLRCPKCRLPLADCELRQLNQDGQRYKVEVTCGHCQMVVQVEVERSGELSPD